MVHRCVIRRVNLHRVVAAAFELINVGIGHVRHQRAHLRVFVEKMFAIEAPVGRRIFLKLAIDGLMQAAQQRAFMVTRKQRIPVGTPQHFQHVPTSTRVKTFKLLNDRAIAAHRAIEPLQIAIDHENQIVEPLAGGERERSERLGFVHLAIADKTPHLAL